MQPTYNPSVIRSTPPGGWVYRVAVTHNNPAGPMRRNALCSWRIEVLPNPGSLLLNTKMRLASAMSFSNLRRRMRSVAHPDLRISAWPAAFLTMQWV